MSLNLKEIVTSFHIMLQSPQFTKVVTMSQLYQHIMEGLFAHFFPDTGNSKAVYSKEDIKFFLTFANEQDKQKAYSQLLSQDDQSANSISLSKFKFHLDRILCKGWSKSEIVAKPLTFYKLEVKSIVISYLASYVNILNMFYGFAGLYLCWRDHIESASRDFFK